MPNGFVETWLHALLSVLATILMGAIAGWLFELAQRRKGRDW